MYVMNLVDGSLQKYATHLEHSATIISTQKNPAPLAIKEIVRKFLTPSNSCPGLVASRKAENPITQELFCSTLK